MHAQIPISWAPQLPPSGCRPGFHPVWLRGGLAAGQQPSPNGADSGTIALPPPRLPAPPDPRPSPPHAYSSSILIFLRRTAGSDPLSATAFLFESNRWRWWWRCRKHRRASLIPGWGRCPLWRRAWQPTPVFLPAESHGQSSLAGCDQSNSRAGQKTGWTLSRVETEGERRGWPGEAGESNTDTDGQRGGEEQGLVSTV